MFTIVMNTLTHSGYYQWLPINNPRTEADKDNGALVLILINGLIDKGKFTRRDIDKELDKLNLINKPSYQLMEKILKQFCELTYNKKTKTYTVK